MKTENNKKSLDELKKENQFDALNETESGQLEGGFNELSAQAEGIITVNFSKCSCGTTEAQQ